MSLWTGELFVREGPAHSPSDTGGAGRRPRWGSAGVYPQEGTPLLPALWSAGHIPALSPSSAHPSGPISDISPLLLILGQERRPWAEPSPRGPLRSEIWGGGFTLFLLQPSSTGIPYALDFHLNSR